MAKKNYVKPTIAVEPLCLETLMTVQSYHALVYDFEEGGEMPDSED